MTGHTRTIDTVRETIFTVCLTLFFSAIPRAHASESKADSVDVSQLIGALADPDAVVRAHATDRLVELGQPARPALLRAARSDDPEQRARAAEVLRRLPWSLIGDPPEARTHLAQYGQADDAGRISLIVALHGSSANARVLLRLLNEEPSDTVRWAIVAVLWDEVDADTLQLVRKLDIASDDPQTLLLAGRAWIERNRPRTLELFRRAIDADDRRPTADRGMLGIAYDELTEAALVANDFDTAADLLRRQIPRDTLPQPIRRPALDDDDSTHSLAKLIALQRYFGPLRGLESDRRLAEAAEANAQPLFSLATPLPSPLPQMSQLFDRLGVPVPIVFLPVSQMAAADRHLAGLFLFNNGYTIAAEIELRAALELATNSHINPIKANAELLLAQVMVKQHNDEAAANFLESGLQTIASGGMEMRRRIEDDIRSEIQWRRARAAHAKGDIATENARVYDLLQLTPTNTDLSISMVEWLEETSRPAEAHAFFEKIYIQSRARVDTTEARRQAGYQNDLAWFCARCGKRPDDAIKLAEAAVAAYPENSAFLDTLAEANYRAGNREKAIRIETRAAELMSENTFILEQLERFKTGKP